MRPGGGLLGWSRGSMTSVVLFRQSRSWFGGSALRLTQVNGDPRGRRAYDSCGFVMFRMRPKRWWFEDWGLENSTCHQGPLTLVISGVKNSTRFTQSQKKQDRQERGKPKSQRIMQADLVIRAAIEITVVLYWIMSTCPLPPPLPLPS